MANLSIPVLKNVRALDGATIRSGTAGGTISVGDWVYIASDGDWERADASASSTALGRGIVVASVTGETAIAAGEGLAVVSFGPVAGFEDLEPGAAGFTSNDAGKLEDAAGTVTWVGGYAESPQVFFVMPGLALPES